MGGVVYQLRGGGYHPRGEGVKISLRARTNIDAYLLLYVRPCYTYVTV